MKIYAVRPNDVKEVDYKNSGVKFKIKPLPFRVKQELMNEQAVLAYNNTKIIDVAGMAVKAVKYGCAGWSGLKYDDGEIVEPKFVRCKEYDVECLSDESMEMIYNTSAFDDLATMCKEPVLVEKFIRESSYLKESESKNLEPPEKKSRQSRKHSAG